MRKTVLAFAASLLIATQVWAIPILPGTTSLAAAEIEPLGGVVVAGPLVTPFVGAAFNATVTSTVIQGDASNPYGGLTFLYEVANRADSTHAVGRFTATGYTAWLTDMSFQAGGGLPPTYMDRSLPSDVVGFSFFGPPIGPAVLSPGLTSSLLIVQTDAPAWTTSVGNVINGSVASGQIYSPVPEPATMVLLIGGLGLLIRRR